MTERKIEIKFTIDDNELISGTTINASASARDCILAAMYLLENAFKTQHRDLNKQDNTNPVAGFIADSFNAYLAIHVLEATQDAVKGVANE